MLHRLKENTPPHQDNVNICTTHGGDGWGYESSRGGCHDNRILKGYAIMLKQYREPCVSYTGLLGHVKAHNAQESVINWAVAAYGRKSNVKGRSNFNVIWWFMGEGGRCVQIHVEEYRTRQELLFLTNLFSWKKNSKVLLISYTPVDHQWSSCWNCLKGK